MLILLFDYHLHVVVVSLSIRYTVPDLYREMALYKTPSSGAWPEIY